VDVVDIWLNLLEGYFLVHNFFDREKITFALLKVVTHVKDWWDTYSDQRVVEESTIFAMVPTWDTFRDAIKEQYYPVGSTRTNTLDGSPYVKKGSRQYQISPIFSIPYAPNWVSKTLSIIWCSNITVVYIDTFG
jgi:hypothetical protein